MSAPLAIWRASFRAFSLRCVALFVFTYVLLTPSWPLIGGGPALLVAVVLTLTYMFALDDFSIWRRHRQAVWTLTPDALIYENPVEVDGPHHLALADIRSMHPRLFVNLVLRLHSGTSVTMQYIDAPRTVRDDIARAQQELAA